MPSPSNPASLFTAVTSTSASSLTSGSFTPTGGSLLVVTATVDSATAPSLSIADSAGLTWTTVKPAAQQGGTTVFLQCAIFTAVAPLSPSPMTVTVTSTGGGGRMLLEGYKVTGHSGLGLSASTPAGSSSVSSQTVTLPSQQAVTSLLIGVVAEAATLAVTFTPPAGWTGETQQSAGLAAPFVAQQTSYINTSTAQANTFTSNRSSVMCAAVVEILAILRSLADTVTVSDGPARAVLRPRSLADTVNVSDSLARSAVTRTRTTGDTITVSDTPARVDVETRTVGDAITVSDSPARDTAGQRGASDSITVSDNPTRAHTDPRGLADTVTVSDTLAGQAGAGRPLGDLITVTDTALTRLATARALADLIAVADSLTYTIPAGPTPAERRYLIGAEKRALAVAGERRLVTVGAETRLVTVGADNRILSIPFEDRTVKEA